MRELPVYVIGLLTGAAWGASLVMFLHTEKQRPEPTLPPIVVTKPACEWGGPYPYSETTEMWIVICAKGEGDG